MPIDKRKLPNNSPAWTPTISLSLNAFYLLLIFTSLAWNVYNTQQYQILADRQLKLELLLADVLPAGALLPSLSPFDGWMNKVLHFLAELTGSTNVSRSAEHILAQPHPVSDVFLEMLAESLDTCLLARTLPKVGLTCMTN